MTEWGRRYVCRGTLLTAEQRAAGGQAKKEGDAEVVRRLEEVLKVAMSEKQKTLRPEIQLLNRLLAVESSAERRQASSLHAGRPQAT